MFKLNNAKKIAKSIIEEQGWTSNDIYVPIRPHRYSGYDLVLTDEAIVKVPVEGTTKGGGFLFSDWVVVPVVQDLVRCLTLREFVVLLCSPPVLRRLYRERWYKQDWQSKLMCIASGTVTEEIVKLLPEPAQQVAV